jgi:hypothetical protein
MAFPTTAFSDPTSAQSALMNKATENGLSAIVADGNDATVNAILANMFTEMPAGVALGPTLATEAGAGFTSGTGTIYESAVFKAGGIINTQIIVDLTGLNDFAAGDIIGKSASTSPAHIGQVTAARNGTIFAVRMTCLELPAGADVDIDLYSATEGTGAPDSAISALVETQLINSGDWTAGAVKIAQTVAADQYLYLVNGDSTAGTYTAGKYLIELFGY